ncbi:MAG: glycosyltransferase [Bacteroidetes bacterium]|nr:glycosyltransferase [Bacteroidota bacterium]
MNDNSSHNKITLLVLTPTLECGGSERYVSLLCNYINTDLFNVVLGVLNNEQPFYTITNAAVTVVDLKVKHVRSSFFAIRHLIKQYQPAIVYSTSNHLNLYLAVFRNLFSKEIVFAARESSVVSENTKNAKWPWMYHRLIKKFYHRLDHVICQSEFMQQDLVERYLLPKDKTIIINNPVEVMGEPGAAPGQYTFITVARLSKEKGIERLLQALALLDIPFQYFIIGDGPLMQSLQQSAKQLQLLDKVVFCGQVKQPFINTNATLYLMGSYYEGFPNSVLEAQSHGIPVLAYDVPGGIAAIIEDGVNGLLVKESTAQGMSEAIEKALHLNFNRILIQQQTRQRYGANTIVQRTETFFRQCIMQEKSG